MFVLGTAGHVDHGKSTLITKLTGIDPDRLAEEKKRGLTIDLGFAWMTLPSGREIGIVDVPGHERFVHNMLAGAGQIDAVLFVVDATEGWRRQSEEHLAILDLLDVGGGIVAVTKADLAADGGEATHAEVSSRLKGTALENAWVMPVSAVTGTGIPELINAIDLLLSTAPEPRDDGRPRLCIDRSFTIKGSGTVATGTLTGGRLHERDEVVIQPAGLHARIRGIQTHRASRREAAPTSRVALNLAGLERHEIRRGDAVVLPGQWRPSTLLDVELRGVRFLDHRVTGKGTFMLYLGTAEVPAQLRLMGESLGADERIFARLTLGAPVIASPGDRLVLRDTGRRQTVAGGAVLDAHPASQKLRGSDTAQRIEELSLRAGAPRDSAPDRTVAERGVVAAEQLAALSGAAEAPSAHRLPSYFVAREWLDRQTERIRAELEAFHANAPLERGMPRETLRQAAQMDDQKLFAETIELMSGDGALAVDGPAIRLASHRVTLSPELQRAHAALEAEMSAAGFSPPGLKDLGARYGDPLLKTLQESGRLVRLADDVVYLSDQVAEAKKIIADAVATEGPLTASRIRELLGTSRKYAIPLLEHLDAAGFTKRDGDVRTVRA